MPHTSLFTDFPAEDTRHHRPDIDRGLRRVLDGGQFILQGETTAFEAEFAAHIGVNHVIGVASGTDAIEILLRARDVGAGDKVVLPAFAPSAVASAVHRAGADILLVDIEPDTFTLCPRSLQELLDSPRGVGVKAVLAVHLYGHPADWKRLRRVCDAHEVVLWEDAAQAHGAVYHERQAGSLAVAAAFSFYPTKNLAAAGDAGAVATSDDEVADKVRLARQYGWRQRHISGQPGMNSRLDEMQAAILRTKLPGLEKQVERRREIAALYASRLHGVGVPVQQAGCAHAFHQFVIRSSHRDELSQHLSRRGIPVAVHYPAALHQQPAFFSAEVFPEAERAATQVLSLPLHPYLKDEAVEEVCAVIEEFDHGCSPA